MPQRSGTTARTYANGRYVTGVTHGRGRGRGKSPAGQAYDALRYMQMRELGPGERPEDRRFFSAAGEGGSWDMARQIIMTHATARVAYHRLILSPGQEVADMQEWTRMVMDDLAAQIRQELHWVAVVHRNTEHPHAHVLLAGGGERDGALQPVILRREHYTLLREWGDRDAAHLRVLGQERTAGLRRLLSREERLAKRINAAPLRAEKERDAARDGAGAPAEDLCRQGAVATAGALARMFRQAGMEGSDPRLDERAGHDR